MTDHINAPETVTPVIPTTSTVAAVVSPTTESSLPPASTGAASENPQSPVGPTPHEKRKGALAYLENALTLAVDEVGKEGVVVVHSIENEYQAMKSFLEYQLQALKGKLGLK